MRTQAVGFLLGVAACAPTSRVTVDRELRREAAPVGDARRQTLEIRVTDGERTWTVAVPDGVDGYELLIPTKGEMGRSFAKGGEKGRGDQAKGKDGGDAATIAVAHGATPDVEMTAYLRAIARVKELRDGRNLELALLETIKLARVHPKRARVFAMLGTLHAELGHKAEARTAWRRAVELDPKDSVTADALDRLEKE